MSSEQPTPLPLHQQDKLKTEDQQFYDEKAEGELSVYPAIDFAEANANDGGAKQTLALVGGELKDLESRLETLDLERTVRIAKQLYVMHEHDPNFPGPVLGRMHQFLHVPDVLARPDKYPELVREMKLEALLATEDSPYVEVRAVADPFDDVDMPALTLRVWIIGVIASGCGSFIDTLFGYRNPPISVGPNVGQLLAYPFGKFLEKVLPKHTFKIFGRECSMNPGPFNQKEHMLITIMASVSFTAPYTNYIVPAQAMPMFFGESFAYKRGYQFINTIGTNFVGYGLAGLARRFLVYPSIAVWPATLNTLGLVKAFHTETNEPVKGPFGRTYTASREKFFLWMFGAMFIWYFFPGFIFSGISVFSWMTWIAPNNANLATVTGFQSGMGLNPWPTFDFNNLTVWLYPLTIPTFSIINMFFGILLGSLMCLAVYYSNSWNTAYIPINSNSAYDNLAQPYNVSLILNDDNQFVDALYQEYSQPWMSSGFIISYLWYFALYSATLTWIVLYHRHDLATAYRAFANSVRKLFKKTVEENEDDLSEDVHFRLMQAYPEVHEWEYMIVLIIAMVLGMVGVGIYPTNTSPVVVIFGIIFTFIVVIPCGMIQAVTGIAVPLNVLAEFIGGSLTQGNANGLMYFKTYGYISAYQALSFSNDLKLAHYMKLKPRHTFSVQLVATFIYCMVSAAIFNFAMGFRDACTEDAAFRFTCPNQRTFFTASVFWGTISPHRLFGKGKRYNLMLLGFPLGVGLVLVHWALRKRWPHKEILRQVHPVMFCAGPSTWGSPYNMSYYIGNVYLVLISFQYIRKRYLAFWVKYNYVLAAAWPCGVAISGIVIFFALEIPKNGLSIVWWGNTVVGTGCDGSGGCPKLTLAPGDYFGPAKGSFT